MEMCKLRLPTIIVITILIPTTTCLNVAQGMLGGSISLGCSNQVSDTLAWERSDGAIVAVGGGLVDRNTSKYTVERQERLGEFLIIHNLTLEDDYRYSCYDLLDNSNRDVTTVNILVKPFHMEVTSPESDVNEGETVTLTCMSDGGKPLPDTSWFREDVNGTLTEMSGRLVDDVYRNRTGRRTNVLTFTVSRDMYDSKFMCHLSVSAFFFQSLSVKLNLKLMPLPPTISGYTGSYDADRVLSLGCESRGSSSAADVYWLVDGKSIVDFELIVIPESDRTFTVTSSFNQIMTRDNNGSVVTCAVTNKVVKEMGLRPPSASISLVVNYVPIISLSSSTHETTEGSNVVIHCSVDARPETPQEAVVWRKNGVIINNTLMTVFKRNVYHLSLLHVTRIDAGSYSCQATNRLGTTESSKVQLSVHYQPECTVTGVMKYAAKIGSSVVLQCSMRSSPSDVMMTWQYKNTQQLIQREPASNQTAPIGHVYSSIDISISDQLQYGLIECSGTNSAGMVSSQPCLLQIVPPGPPEPPRNCSILLQDNGSVGIRCLPGFDGGSKQRFLLQHLEGSNSRILGNRSVPSFDLDLLSHVTGNVTLRVCAVNEESQEEIRCSQSFNAIIQATASTRHVTVTTEEDSQLGIILGVVSAFLFLLLLTAMITYCIHRQKKHENEQSNFMTDMFAKIKRCRVTFKCQCQSDPTDDVQHPGTRQVRESSSVTIFSISSFQYDVICQPEGKVLASTPYLPAKNISNQTTIPRDNISQHFYSDINQTLAPTLKYHLKGRTSGRYAPSPIKKVPMTFDGGLRQVEKRTNDSENQSADGSDVIICYSETDIAAVLDTTSAPRSNNIYEPKQLASLDVVIQMDDNTELRLIDPSKALNSLFNRVNSLPLRLARKRSGFSESRTSETYERSNSLCDVRESSSVTSIESEFGKQSYFDINQSMPNDAENHSVWDEADTFILEGYTSAISSQQVNSSEINKSKENLHEASKSHSLSILSDDQPGSTENIDEDKYSMYMTCVCIPKREKGRQLRQDSYMQAIENTLSNKDTVISIESKADIITPFLEFTQKTNNTQNGFNKVQCSNHGLISESKNQENVAAFF